ncbi:MAG: rRNA maturation RNase YbeY [Treponema sp.]|nr:rRNA maturation RNase YbeY [Treponema sp.]
MKNNVFVSVQDGLDEPEWISKIVPFEQTVLEKISAEGEEVSILFCNDDFIQELTRTYRNIDAPTDVLSFENGETYTDEEGSTWRSMGDIIISLETVPKNAEYFGVPEDEELKRLLIHGTLHINGFDHGEEHIEKGVQPTGEMLTLQEKILGELSDIHIL